VAVCTPVRRLFPVLVLVALALLVASGIAHLTESGIGRWLALPLLAGGTVAIALSRPSAGPRTSDSAGPAAGRSRLGPFIAAGMAYGFYVAAALIADAGVPQFFRDHLFDGFAPAAAVGLLIDRFPGRYVNEFPEDSWKPFVTSLLYFLAGGAVFGGIAAAAVFGSNRNDFLYPVLWCGLFGGLTFPIAYLSTVRFSKVQSRDGGEEVDAPPTVTATPPLATPHPDDAGSPDATLQT
jgi:hypothetical protein